jgi:anaerobic selenocysteine-containing dehydrogenase
LVGQYYSLLDQYKVSQITEKTVFKSLSLAYKKRALSPNWSKYPLKRVDWDPNGERNPQNRGNSKYKRISCNEATDIIAAEIKPIHKTFQF